MPHRKKRKFKPILRPRPKEPPQWVLPYDPDFDAPRQRRWVVMAIGTILLAFGIYKAYVLWGAYPIPNPDFPGFIGIGKQLLAGTMPVSFKRAPAVGVMQVLISRILPVANPELTAGWLLNAVLSAFNGVLLYLLGRRFVGHLAGLIAVVVTLNPWVLVAQVDPVAETTMLFFIVLTFVLLARNSRWAYLTASIGSMVRYECSALIAIVFAIDILSHGGWRQRSVASILAILASVPFGVWMWGTYVTWNPGASHYLRHYGHGTCALDYLKYLGQSAFQTYFHWPQALTAQWVQRPESFQKLQLIEQTSRAVSLIVLLLACGGTILSLIFGWVRRNKILLGMWAFILLYLPVHMLRAQTHHRYTVPIAGLLLMLSCTGWKNLMAAVLPRRALPRALGDTMAILIAAVFLVWLAALLRILPAIDDRFLPGRYLVLSALGAIALIGLVEWLSVRPRSVLRNLAFAAVAAVASVSVQFTAVSVIGGGQRIEFKKLADWYMANSKPGERLADRYAGTLRLIVPGRRDDFVNASAELRSETLEQFIQKCYQQNIRYVTWSPRGSSSAKAGLEAVGKILSEPRDHGPLQFVERIAVSDRQWINIFRLLGPDEMTPMLEANDIR